METAVKDNPELLDELRAMQPEALLEWAFQTYGQRAGIITSFQDTGCVTIDMASRVAPGLRVLTIDTLRLHPETYQLMEEIEARYSIEIEHYKPDPDRLKKMVGQHGEYLFFDSKTKQEFCCQVRKVEPNVRALQTVDLWITGLRRDHSAGRQTVEKAEFISGERSTILKLSPLADWDTSQVRAYIDEHAVPYSSLYDQGYTSIGCTICSTPTQPWEDKRAGRWRWFNALDDDNKECGIHINTSGDGI